jgi:tetratricopeptide (TPR) repeat protein
MIPARPKEPAPVLSQLLQAARVAWQQSQRQRSIDLLEQATRIAPEDPRILFDLGRCRGLRHDYEAAERCFEKAIRISGWKTEAFIQAGRCCLNFFQDKMAERYFERALKRDGNSTETLGRLAQICLRSNRLAEAAGFADRALFLDKDFPPALVARGILFRLEKEPEKSEALLRSFVNRPCPDPWMHAQGWYELGTTLDVQERYDEAMAAFLEAKTLLRPSITQAPVNPKTAREDLEKTADVISSDLLRRWNKEGEAFTSRYRLAVLCGHPRSGTTLLEQVLDTHPDIVTAEESNVFHDEVLLPITAAAKAAVSPLSLLDSVDRQRLEQARHDYFTSMQRFLRQPIEGRLVIDKNPSLTARIPIIIRIFPEARFIVAIRDPRDVCLSCFMQPLMPLSPIASVFATLEATAAEYSFVMGFWQMIKSRLPNPFLEVRYEEMVDDLPAIARRTLEFLEVPWNDQVLDFQKHSQNKLVRSPTYADVRKPVTKRAVGRWRNYQKYLEPHLPILEPFVKAFGYD